MFAGQPLLGLLHWVCQSASSREELSCLSLHLYASVLPGAGGLGGCSLLGQLEPRGHVTVMEEGRRHCQGREEEHCQGGVSDHCQGGGEEHCQGGEEDISSLTLSWGAPWWGGRGVRPHVSWVNIEL